MMMTMIYHQVPTLKRIVILLLCLFIAGCFPKTPEVRTLSEGEQKLERLLHDDMKLDVTIRPQGDTLYLYAPMETNLHAIKSSPYPPPMTHNYRNVLEVNHVETRYENRTFYVDYDIAVNRAYPIEDPGVLTATSREFQQLSQKILKAVLSAFGDLDGKDGKDTGPEFIVVVIVNIKSGIHTKLTFHFEDYRKIQANALAFEESRIRILQQMLGDKNLIDDRTGKNLDYKEITWGDFLARQIKNRINFMIPKTKDINADINETVNTLTYQTLSAYDFDGYDNVVFRDLRDETIETLQKEELEKYKEQVQEPEQGRIYNLRFNYDPDKGVTMEEVDPSAEEKPLEAESKNPFVVN